MSNAKLRNKLCSLARTMSDGVKVLSLVDVVCKLHTLQTYLARVGTVNNFKINFHRASSAYLIPSLANLGASSSYLEASSAYLGAS